MQDCIFCKISNGEAKSWKVYEDENVFAFLDRHPINPGHVLVIPKQHATDFFDLENEIYTKLMLAVKQISKKVNEVTKPKKVGLLVAGFDVPHMHVHIVPMHDYHDLNSKSSLEGKRVNPTDEELAEVTSTLKF